MPRWIRECSLGYCSKTCIDCIENELLGSLEFSIHNIAPYHSEDIEKAEELIVGCTAQASSNNKAGQSNEIDQASISGTLEESREFSRKRPRIESFGDALFDLNLPADAH